MTKPEAGTNKTKHEADAEQPPAAAGRPPDSIEEFDPVAVNPFYRGLRFSEVVRAVLSPLDPEVREKIRRRARRDSGPRRDRTPDPGR